MWGPKAPHQGPVRSACLHRQELTLLWALARLYLPAWEVAELTGSSPFTWIPGQDPCVPGNAILNAWRLLLLPPLAPLCPLAADSSSVFF